MTVNEFGAERHLRPKKPRILAVANQKGGVGKTTTAINLGTGLAAVGENVLIIDLDPQGNASTGFGIPRNERKVSTYELLIGEEPLETTIMPTKIPHLSIVPSTVDLSGAELELVNVPRRSFRLRDGLTGFFDHPPAGAPRFDYILIDCPPSLNLLTVNAMTASDGVLVPLQCEFFALEGLSQLLRTVELVKT
ncbi:ParA family protein, partial [bacterium AH-315-P15]|nr:ParA family protein [bacterium AH-315-P15]